MATHSANPNVTPMDVLLAVMRDPHVPLERRVKMALKALPRLHRKLSGGESACVSSEQSLGSKRRKKSIRCVPVTSTVPRLRTRSIEAAR
jgi:hypothetical protein